MEAPQKWFTERFNFVGFVTGNSPIETLRFPVSWFGVTWRLGRYCCAATLLFVTVHLRRDLPIFFNSFAFWCETESR